MDREKAVRLVGKLLKFRGDVATEGEIENAMAIAQRIMEKHAIDEAELYESQADRAMKESQLKSRVAEWESDLAAAVRVSVPGVSWYRCTATRTKFGAPGARRVGLIVWYGPADAVNVAHTLFCETRTVISTMASGCYGNVYRGEGRSYSEGFAQKLYARAKAQRSAGVRAIVLASGRENEAWLARTTGIHLIHATGRQRAPVDHCAYRAGQRDGAAHEFAPGRASPKLGSRRALPAGGGGS